MAIWAQHMGTGPVPQAYSPAQGPCEQVQRLPPKSPLRVAVPGHPGWVTAHQRSSLCLQSSLGQGRHFGGSGGPWEEGDWGEGG